MCPIQNVAAFDEMCCASFEESQAFKPRRDGINKKKWILRLNSF